MKVQLKLFGFVLLTLFSVSVIAQDLGELPTNDSVRAVELDNYNKKLVEIEQLRVADSLKRIEIEAQLEKLKTTDNIEKADLINQLNSLNEAEQKRIETKKARINSLKSTTLGFPVIGVMDDTLFHIYSRIGALTPKERAQNITQKIKKMYSGDLAGVEGIKAVQSENYYDIVSGEYIIMSVTENDALWYEKDRPVLADSLATVMKESIIIAKKKTGWVKTILRSLLVILVIVIAYFIVKLIGKGYQWLLLFIHKNKEKWLKDFSYKNYTFMTADQELVVIEFLIKIMRWVVYAVFLYITLPIIFSIFPFSRDWADALFQLIWSPFKGVLVAVWAYLPNLFSILVIYFVMKYVIKFGQYIFGEIESEKLVLSGFHADWAMPTYSIVKFLLYAFMFVMIFPYLPGSDSNIFKGVSVFIGVLFSLGSSSAIANMVAGLVITYMRPFKIGDRIKIADVTGDVIEKTLLVTRLKTTKNEIITIPNSSVLSGNTINYSTQAEAGGLIVYSTITIGYDVPWQKMHQTLIEAALRTDMILKEPKPFVLQTGLEDFYVSYQINAYTKDAGKQALIYSNLHQNIQDCCNEAGIEILSPHYRAARDGNMVTIPANYLPNDYKAPSFNVKVNNGEQK